jgi:hypothetical protein
VRDLGSVVGLSPCPSPPTIDRFADEVLRDSFNWLPEAVGDDVQWYWPNSSD